MIDPATKIEFVCPLKGKLCIDGRREDFPENKVGGKHQCRWWQHITGKDPQSEKLVDAWDCAIAWFPSLLIEGSQMGRQTAASVDKLANEVGSVKSGIGLLGQVLRNVGEKMTEGIKAGVLHVFLPPKSENGQKPDA